MKRVKNLVVGCGLTGMVLAERLASEYAALANALAAVM